MESGIVPCAARRASPHGDVPRERYRARCQLMRWRAAAPIVRICQSKVHQAGAHGGARRRRGGRMDTLPQDSAPATPVALGVLTAVVYVAGFATVAAWFALA